MVVTAVLLGGSGPTTPAHRSCGGDPTAIASRRSRWRARRNGHRRRIRLEGRRTRVNAIRPAVTKPPYSHLWNSLWVELVHRCEFPRAIHRPVEFHLSASPRSAARVTTQMSFAHFLPQFHPQAVNYAGDGYSDRGSNGAEIPPFGDRHHAQKHLEDGPWR